jgi:purine-binding chemotaxis protein CheW
MVKVVVFSLAGELYAFPGRDVLEILPVEGISPIPGTPECIPGLITVRGDIESVIDLRKTLELPARGDAPGQILLATGGAVRSGVLIDSVEDVVDVPRSAILPAPQNLDRSVREFVAGELEREGRNVTLLDPAGIFAQAVVP